MLTFWLVRVVIVVVERLEERRKSRSLLVQLPTEILAVLRVKTKAVSSLPALSYFE